MASGPSGSAYTYRDLNADPVPLVDVARTELAAQSSAAGVREMAGMAAAIVPFLARFADAHLQSVNNALEAARTLSRTLPADAPTPATA